MSALGWILFAACCVVCGVIGWQLRGWRYEVLEFRAEEESWFAQRGAEGAPITEKEHDEPA